MKRKLDKLDLQITEIEARITTTIRHEIIQECLSHCRLHHPGCPHLDSTELCEDIQEALDTLTPSILQDMSEKN